MNRSVWEHIGVFCFWLTRPLLAIYLRGSKRTRIIVEHQNMILVVKGWLGDGRWALPGGGVHKNETLIDGVLRELSEETGIVLDSKEHILPIGRFDHSGLFNFVGYYFYFKAEELYQTKPQMWEITKIEWVDIDDLNKTTASKELLKALDLWKNTVSAATM